MLPMLPISPVFTLRLCLCGIRINFLLSAWLMVLGSGEAWVISNESGGRFCDRILLFLWGSRDDNMFAD
jgi:hypothetical protein